MSNKHEETARRLLPCQCNPGEGEDHISECPVSYRLAVAAALGERDAEIDKLICDRDTARSAAEVNYAELAQLRAKLAQANSLHDLIASGGLPEATPIEAGAPKTREQLIADKDALYAENKNLKAERDAAYKRGLMRAIEILDCLRPHQWVLTAKAAFRAEIDRAGK